MVRVRLIIEGGSEGRRQSGTFRAAWRNFFQSAGLTINRINVTRGGSRNQTFDRFLSALRNAEADELPILLVDSEGPVAAGRSVWEHLQANDRWARSPGVGDEQAFLMVQTMETWLLADRDALRRYFGASFRENRLPSQHNLEGIDKETALQSLELATADCNKQYAKGAVSFEILGRINPNAVAERCPHAKALLDFLRSL